MPKRINTVRTPWRHRSRRQTQRGGRFIGSGTYGCGFRPALKCEGEAHRRHGKFAKLVQLSVAEEELAYRDLLSPLDPERRFFLYPEDVCIPARPYDPADGVDECRYGFKDTDDARVIIMGKGGANLQKLQLRPREYLPFFQSLRGIFEGLARINGAGIAHMDVKPPNIVTRQRPDGSFHTRLIDFGLMIDPARLDEWGAKPKGTFKRYTVLKSNYLYWPFEVRFGFPGMIEKAIAQDASITDEITNYYKELTTIRMSVPYNGMNSQKLTPVGVSIIAAPFAGLAGEARYRALFSKVDVHGLGITLAQIYYRFTGHRDIGARDPVVAIKTSPASTAPIPVKSLAPNEHLSAAAVLWHKLLEQKGSIPLYTLVRAMTYPLIDRRPTIIEAMERFTVILADIAEGLTPARVAMAIKPWMLDKDVLVEAPTPVAGAAAAGGAGAVAASSSSSEEEIAAAGLAVSTSSSSSERAVPAPSAPPASPGMLARMAAAAEVPAGPGAAGGAGRAAAVVVPVGAANNAEEMPNLSASPNKSRPALIPAGNGFVNVSLGSSTSSGSGKTNKNSAGNANVEKLLNSLFPGADGW